jgi:8-oxo-dGTP pyrophosphatase MutT (NUDIX family)
MQPPSDSHQSRAAVKELLLEEYRNFSDSFWKNEQTGETRVNWFIGIVAAASGGLIGLASAEHRPHGEALRLIFVASLVALLVFGLITLLRIMKRNETTDGYKRDCDRVRRMFKEYFDDDKLLRQYHPFGRQGNKDLARKLGGLAHTVLAINSLLFAGLAAASVYPIGGATSLRSVYAASIVAFVAAAAGQFFWVWLAERNAKKNLATLTHAGGIVYRLNDGKVEYLLVGPKKDVPDEWLLPKGHIEGSEEHWETALREVREETGVVGRPISRVGTDEYETKERVAVKFYLVEYCSEVECEEKRRRKWFTLEQAMNLLNFPGSQRLLRKAEQKRLSLSRK